MQVKMNTELALHTIGEINGFRPQARIYLHSENVGYGKFIKIRMKLYVLATTVTLKQYYHMNSQLENVLN